MSLDLTLHTTTLHTTAEVPSHFGPATHPASPKQQMYDINTDAGKWQTGPCSLQLTGRYTISMSH